MHKLSLVIAGLLLVATLPAIAQDGAADRARHSAMQHQGGHSRHMHRDWSGTGGRGHAHNVCWEWDIINGWEWVCR